MKTTPPKPPRRASAPPTAPEDGARVARRERRRERSREEIVAAARRVLLREGLAGTTLAAVAREVGLAKTALYHYFPSKDALIFEVVYAIQARQAQAVHDAVADAADGGAALGAIVRELVRLYTPRMDDFRLAYLHGQVAAPGSVAVAAQQLARIRPLNELAFADAARRLAEEASVAPTRAGVDPRLMAFLASVAAVGLLTMKGMVESAGDPLRYTDDELVDGLARVFAAAARP